MAWLPDSILLDSETQSVGASATNQVVSEVKSLTAEGAKRLRVTFYIGTLTDADDSTTVGLQHSSGYRLWTSTKTGDLGTTKSGAAFTAATTDILTDTSHGLSTDDAVVVANSGGALPGGLAASTIYYVVVIDANTFYLATKPGSDTNDRVDITSTGSGTNSYYAVSEVSITFNPEVAGDQSYVPLKNLVRAVATTGSGDAIDIVDVTLTQET